VFLVLQYNNAANLLLLVLGVKKTQINVRARPLSLCPRSELKMLRASNVDMRHKLKLFIWPAAPQCYKLKNARAHIIYECLNEAAAASCAQSSEIYARKLRTRHKALIY